MFIDLPLSSVIITTKERTFDQQGMRKNSFIHLHILILVFSIYLQIYINKHDVISVVLDLKFLSQAISFNRLLCGGTRMYVKFQLNHGSNN